MLARLTRICALVPMLGMASLSIAQMPGRVDLEVAEMAAALIGAPVFAADGLQVGDVLDVAMDDEGRIQALRMRTGAILGFGARTVEISQGTFTALRGAVVIDLPAEVVQSLPEVQAKDADEDK